MNGPPSAPTVVVGTGDAVRSSRLRDALLAGSATELRLLEPAAAREAVGEPEVGCLLADRALPGTTGVDLCRDVRARDASLPVVFYAGEPDDGIPRELLNAGADGYYTPDDPLETVRDGVDEALAAYGRRREARLERAAFDALLDDGEPNVYVKDGDGRYLRAASASRGEDPIGKTDVDLYGERNPEMARRTLADDRRVVETGEAIRGQDERYGDDETAHAVRTTKIPWRDGDREGLVGVSVDVTDLKRTEHDLETLRARFEAFAGNLRHDLRNPLQVAAGHLELAEETGGGDHFARARAAIDRIDEMIDDLETVANGSTSGPDGEARSLADVVEDVWTAYPRAATLENRLPSTTRTPVDEAAIRPVLENLFKNAVEHGSTGDDAVEHDCEDVTVRVGALEDGFYVEDTGRGIPESEREAVLEPGYTTDPEGTGVGLGLVADVCEARGWEMEIGESPEGGARFAFTDCPLVAAPTAEDRPDVADGTRLDLGSEAEIGDLDAGASAAFDPEANRWTVAADGDNVWRERNDLGFVYATADGDVSVRARLVDIEEVDPMSKAGVMIRDRLDAESTYGYVGGTPGFGTELLWRSRPDEAGVSHQLGGRRAEWLRADLLGEWLTCFVSADGDRWTPIDQRPIERTGPVHAGIAVCSAVAGRRCEATFEDVTVVSLDRADRE